METPYAVHTLKFTLKLKSAWSCMCTFMYARDFLQEPAQCVENWDKGMITILSVSVKESVVDADFVDEQHRLSHKYQAARAHKRIGIILSVASQLAPA